MRHRLMTLAAVCCLPVVFLIPAGTAAAARAQALPAMTCARAGVRRHPRPRCPGHGHRATVLSRARRGQAAVRHRAGRQL